MKRKIVLTFLTLIGTIGLFAQEENELNPVLTGAPFLRIAPDARAGGLGDQGVATSTDAYSQYWNPAKFLFSRSYSGLGVSYTPYLNNITNDVFLLNATYYTFLGDSERSTLGASLYYFNLGEVQLNELNAATGEIVQNGLAKPNEFAVDLSYGLKLSDNYSMAVALRYIRSDLFNGLNDPTVQAANSVAVDIAGFYQSERHNIGDIEGKLRAGFNIKNIGPRLDYSSTEDNQSYLPTNLGLGASYDFILDDYNKVTAGLEFNKLLVPTPQFEDTDGDGNIDQRRIPDEGVIGGIFSSFGDAPGGGSEELREVTASASAEYSYNNALFLRAGYFYEAPQKGDRQFLSLGLGFKYNSFGIDASYLVPTSETNSALENTLRFALTWDFGGETYNSYD